MYLSSSSLPARTNFASSSWPEMLSRNSSYSSMSQVTASSSQVTPTVSSLRSPFTFSCSFRPLRMAATKVGG